MSKEWWGPDLDGDQRALQEMLDGLIADEGIEIDDNESQVDGLVSRLAELGVWSIGSDESVGGGGADLIMTTVAFERLGRAWPALGWACVQAHSGVGVLAQAAVDVVPEQISEGQIAVAVVDLTSPHVQLTATNGRLTGSIARVDAASQDPYVLVLGVDGVAYLIEPTGLTFTALDRTGLGGAFTRSVIVDADVDQWREMTGIDVDRPRVWLRRGAAAVAAGIAAAAAESAREYARGRRQFGDALTAIPTVRQTLAGELAGAALALGTVFNAADPQRALFAVRQATDIAVEVAAAGIQSHGGYGYLVEYSAERRFRDALSLRAALDVPAAAVAEAFSVTGAASPVSNPTGAA